MNESQSPSQVAAPGGRLSEIASVFFRLGVFGFGGPIATMAMMEEEAVRRRSWLSASEFSEVYAVCKLLPGPVSTQMAIYLGRIRGGVSGGVVSGMVFILPCFVMVLGLSMLYAETGIVRGAEGVLSGLQAAALAVILVSTWGLARPYRTQARAWAIIAASAAVIYRYSSYEPLVILGFGLLGAFRAHALSRSRAAVAGLIAGASVIGYGISRPGFADAIGAAAPAAGSLWSTLGALFWMCCKAGLFVFGTGLAVVPVLEGDAVGHHHWLTHSQFMDGLAVGQVTPGPVVITSTFIGYLAAKMPGAIAATIGMFLPSFVNVLVLVPRIWRRFSGTPGAQGFSSFAIPAVIGGILGTSFKLGLLTLTAPPVMGIFAVGLGVALWLKPPAWVLIPLAGVAGGFLV